MNDAEHDRKAEALELRLIHGKTVTEIATQLGVTPRAVYKWFAEPGTRAVIEKHREGKLLDLVDLALDNAQKALAVIAAIANDPNISPGVRLQAARHIVDVAIRLLEAQHFAERLSRLEDRAGLTP